MWYGSGYGPGMMSGWGGWGWGLHGILSLVLVGLAAVALVALVRYLWQGGRGTGADASSARRLLDERYARGEIDRTEYLQRRQDIG